MLRHAHVRKLPGSPDFSILQATECWAGSGNKPKINVHIKYICVMVHCSGGRTYTSLLTRHTFSGVEGWVSNFPTVFYISFNLPVWDIKLCRCPHKRYSERSRAFRQINQGLFCLLLYILSTAVSSALGSSNPVSSTNSWILRLD